jgi:secreted trypsin-like serine protease
LAGLVSYALGSRYSLNCGTNSGAVYVNVAHYLEWINRVRLDDLIDDYRSNISQIKFPVRSK